MNRNEVLSAKVLLYQATMRKKYGLKRLAEEEGLIEALKTTIEKVNKKILSAASQREEIRVKVLKLQKKMSTLRDKVDATKETIDKFYDQAHQNLY